MGEIRISISMAIAICLYFATAVLSASIPTSHWMHPRDKGPKNSETNGITEALLQNFRLMAQYSAAAYCPGNNNGTGTLITCPVGNCPLVEAARAHGAFEFENTVWADSTGFVAVDDTNKLVVLAFRGSESLSNWRVNMDLFRELTDLCEDCDVHTGFWHAWTEIRDRAKVRVLNALETHPDYRFVITGHSLGGAIAVLAAGDFRKLNHSLAATPELYTFGSPRVGGKQTAAFLTEQSRLSFRITSVSDPIPRQPGHILGYAHTSPEFWIHAHPRNPGPDDIKVVTGFYNKHGNSGKHGINFSRHMHYFGPITECRTVGDDSF